MRYEKPLMEIVNLDVEDVITTSIPQEGLGSGTNVDVNKDFLN